MFAAHLPLAHVQPELRTERLTPSLYELTGSEDGNILVFVGDRGITLVDAGEATSAPAVYAAVRAISSAPVRTVIVTHYHSDHLGGAGQWRRDGATVLAQQTVRARALEVIRVAELTRSGQPIDTMALPTRTYRDSVELTEGTERITVLHVDSAHTDGDAIVWFHRSNVIHMGDILSIPPGLDLAAGGSIDGVIAGVTRALAIAGPQTRIVPGHGQVTDRAFLESYRRMLVRIRDTVDAAIARGWTRDDLLATHPTAGDGPLLGGERIGPQYVSLVYESRVSRRPNRCTDASTLCGNR